MKFAKELELDLVPEWRVKYFDYKQGKKKIKAVSRALKSVNRTPTAPGRPAPKSTNSYEETPYTHYDFSNRKERGGAQNTTVSGSSNRDNERSRPQPADRRESLTMFAQSPPLPLPQDEPVSQDREQEEGDSSSSDEERRPLQQYQNEGGTQRRLYGSIVGSPPRSDSPEQLPNLTLPGPALDPTKARSRLGGAGTQSATVSKPMESSPDAYHVGPQKAPSRKISQLPKHILDARHKAHGKKDSASTRLRRVFRSRPLDSPAIPDVQLNAYKQLDTKQDDFYNFLDKELEKIEKFYRSKEEDANERLNVLREQLHEMRNRRLEDMQAAKKGHKIADKGFIDGQFSIMSKPKMEDTNDRHSNGHGIMQPMQGILKHEGKIGKTSKAMKELGSPQGPTARDKNKAGASDFVRKKQDHGHVPYRFAKSRLKLALQEFYRGLELLKSYALLNRTAFRKINKKYDKAVNARPTLQYMSEKVNTAYFVQSNVIEGHLVSIEDLYARYFERGHHKVAVSKLRSRLRPGDQSGTTFRNGLYVAAGAGFGISGLVTGLEFLFSTSGELKTQTSYILQIYAGYFLALLLFLIFVIDCHIWQAARVNYVFIFEYDTRYVLDWRQLAELPCFFLFLNGLFLWLNFQFDEAHPMFLYWPVILLGLTLIIIACPLPIFYHRSRKWFAYTNWRLLLAGLYPVEFRDFFSGDLYCSETYTLSQIALFFCIYAHRWDNPAQCNSNHSMLLGFFTALPAVWRALQCLRRYYDTRNWFPHLANFAKYLGNITYYMTLSLYRLNINSERRAAFIVFAIINGVYSSLWDVLMDWSLGNPWAPYPFLRDNLAFRRAWVYYVAIILDVVLRQQWVFYAIFTEDLQHSSAVSFAVGLAEVLRRGMWAIFRVENEHCNNVVQFRASRDVPLPYTLPSSESTSPGSPKAKKKTRISEDDDHTSPSTPAAAGSGVGTAVDLERARSGDNTTGSSLRKRKSVSETPGISTLRRVGTALANAHAQDFQKKKIPGEPSEGKSMPSARKDDSSDEDTDHDDDDDDQESVISDVDHRGKPLSPSKGGPSGKGSSFPSSQKQNTSRTRSRSSSPKSPGTNVEAMSPRSGAELNSSDEEDEQNERRLGPERARQSRREERGSRLEIETTNSRTSEDQQTEAELLEVREVVGRARSPGQQP